MYRGQIGERSADRFGDYILFTRVGDVELTALTPGFVPMKAGRSVWLKIDSKDINLFDPKSRKNLNRLPD